MATATEDIEGKYHSPLRKLVRFFEGSRNRWKAKCLKAKETNKLLRNQVRAVEKSRAAWRSRAEESERRVRELEQQLMEQKAGGRR